MLKNIGKLALLGSCAVLFSVSVLASEGSAIKESGVYVEGNVGYGKLDENLAGFSKNDNSGFLLNANIGYKFMRYIGLELGYTYLPNEDFGEGKDKYGILRTARGNSNRLYDAVVRLTLPFDNGFSLFGKLGIGYLNHDLSIVYPDGGKEDTYGNFPAVAGAGVGYNFTPHFGVNAQFVATSETHEALNVWTNSYITIPATYQGMLGLSYIF